MKGSLLGVAVLGSFRKTVLQSYGKGHFTEKEVFLIIPYIEPGSDTSHLVNSPVTGGGERVQKRE